MIKIIVEKETDQLNPLDLILNINDYDIKRKGIRRWITALSFSGGFPLKLIAFYAGIDKDAFCKFMDKAVDYLSLEDMNSVVDVIINVVSIEGKVYLSKDSPVTFLGLKDLLEFLKEMIKIDHYYTETLDLGLTISFNRFYPNFKDQLIIKARKKAKRSNT